MKTRGFHSYAFVKIGFVQLIGKLVQPNRLIQHLFNSSWGRAKLRHPISNKIFKRYDRDLVS